MKPYIITYDLDNPGQRYKDVKQTIDNFGGSNIKIQKSVWLVRNDLSPDEMTSRLTESIDDNDSLFICELVKNYQGMATDETWKFIKENIFPSQ